MTFGKLELVFSHNGDVYNTVNNVNELNIDLADFEEYMRSKGHNVTLHDVNVDIEEE